MSDYCLYPSQCGIGMDCGECQSAEIIRLRQQLEQAQARVAELESELESYEALKRMHRLEHYPNELAAKAWLLRKQAEAIEAAAEKFGDIGIGRSPFRYELALTLKGEAQRLRQRADELEAETAGGSDA